MRHLGVLPKRSGLQPGDTIGDVATEQRFCESLLAKYGGPDTGRPKGFFPRLNLINVYAIAIERITGKEQLLPLLSEQWPAVDRTKTHMPSQALFRWP